MKKLFLIPLILLSCSSDDCVMFDPCNCLLVTDPVTWQDENENGQIEYTTYFVAKNECKGINEPKHYKTTDINKVPKEFECFKNK
jgi:hypothetical protein